MGYVTGGAFADPDPLTAQDIVNVDEAVVGGHRQVLPRTCNKKHVRVALSTSGGFLLSNIVQLGLVFFQFFGGILRCPTGR